MESKMNRKLSQAARNSALSSSTTPLFVCDMELRLCMYTTAWELYLPHPVLGKSMAQLLPADLHDRLRASADGMLFLPIVYGQIDSHILIFYGDADGEACVICVLHTVVPAAHLLNKAYVKEACQQIAQTAQALLHTPTADAEQLSFSSARLSRLLNIAEITENAAPFSCIRMPKVTELIPYLTSAVHSFSKTFAAVGGSLSFENDRISAFYGACSPKFFGVVLSSLITAAFCRSSDGVVRVSVSDLHSACTEAVVSIIVPAPVPDAPISDLDDLICRMHALRLDLAAAKDIAACSDIRLGCSMDEGRLVLSMTVAYTRIGDIAFHSSNMSVDTLLISRLAAQLFDIYRMERELLRAL